MADEIGFTVCDNVVALTVDTSAADWSFSRPFVVSGLEASLSLSQVSGPSVQFDVLKNGVSILTTKLSIENGSRAGALELNPGVRFNKGDRLTGGASGIGDGTAKGGKLNVLGYYPPQFGIATAPPPPVDPPPPTVTYATWNPADKGASVVLSNGNKTATMPGAGAGVRTTLALPAKCMVEITADAISGAGGGQLLIGVATPAVPLSGGGVGADANGWAYESANGKIYHSNLEAAYSSALVPGDVLGILKDGGNVYFAKNGVIPGGSNPIPAITGLTGTLFVMVSANGGTGTEQATINSGATPFLHPVAGYSGLGV